MTELRYREDVLVAPGYRHVAAIRTSLKYGPKRPYDVAAPRCRDVATLIDVPRRSTIGAVWRATPDHWAAGPLFRTLNSRQDCVVGPALVTPTDELQATPREPICAGVECRHGTALSFARERGLAIAASEALHFTSRPRDMTMVMSRFWSVGSLRVLFCEMGIFCCYRSITVERWWSGW